MVVEFESIPKDLVDIREDILDGLKAMNIEPEPLREILVDVGLGVPITGGLPECPDVSREFMIALGIGVLKKHNLKQFTKTLKATVRILKKEEAQQFEDFIDALFSKHFVKLITD